ncbi:MAG: conjugal transfer protein TrbI, partial [Desulfovibrionaceae bacterium]|nr:conjugal transfer protein TrbI [Desulfovibrionaceae bacterium]
VYDSRVIYGQERVLIAWNRLLFPDGSSLTLGAMPGADMSGYSGFNDQVNHHYAKIFGSAGMLSVILGGTAYTMDSLGSGGGDETTMHGEMISALASTFGQATTQILQKNLNIKPTLEIRPGYEFNVMVTQDLVFREPYQRR